jgi:UDP-2-acetamido-2,6-beta-L-arabino-hexul-4-ose reductase
MINIVVTGAGGFLGKNLCVAFERMEEVSLERIFSSTPDKKILDYIVDADYIYHLAGVNRPTDVNEFEKGNVDFTLKILNACLHCTTPPTIVFTSSIQAELDNVYGRSKLDAEKLLADYSNRLIINSVIYRLPGVFGKWSRPNYNSVVSTFCYNVANSKDIQISDPNLMLKLVYVDDVINSFVGQLDQRNSGVTFKEVIPEYNITLGELGAAIKSFPSIRKSLLTPDMSNELDKRLYSTYLTYLNKQDFAYDLALKKDERGDLFEWIKSSSFGQVFVSTTKPGVTRGNHFHHLKTEKFLVIRGEAEIKFRSVLSEEIVVYAVSGDYPRVVDIPPGYTHSITNTGRNELITLFWANEIFDSSKPDTYFLNV